MTHAHDLAFDYSGVGAMAILSKVEVRIKSAGEPLTEYNDPDESELGDDSTTTKFIEATSGPKFSIEILLHNGYNFHGSDCVIVSRRMDGQTCCMHNIINKDDSRERVTQALKKSIGRDRIFDAESGQWKERSFTFARVEMSMTLYPHFSSSESY